MYNRKDYYYKKAKSEGRASRAGYKLEQIQSKFHIIKKGDFVIDLGCAPGGWLEVLSEMVGQDGVIVGIDLLPLKIPLRPNIKYIQGDINSPESIERLIKLINQQTSKPENHKTDVILSDMAPNTSGVAFKDSYLSYELCLTALDVAKKILKNNGNFVAKIFQGEDVEKFKAELRTCFKDVGAYIPPATRQASKELYLVARGFLGVGHFRRGV